METLLETIVDHPIGSFLIMTVVVVLLLCVGDTVVESIKEKLSKRTGRVSGEH